MDIRNQHIPRKVPLPLVVILGAFVILCLVYTWATPPLEASDELWHFGMINFIADTGLLPVQQPGVKTPYEQEGSQPPLYYMISALLVRGIDRSDFDVVRQANPHAVAGIPGNVGNKNLVLHDSVHPTLKGTVLAVYVVRLFSILLGCITIISIYCAASALGLGQPMLPILAASLTVFNPMFLFITASVNNDNLVTALNSVIIWQLVVLIRTSRFSVRSSLLFGVLLALASLSKLSGLVVMPFVLLGGWWVFLSPKICTEKRSETSIQKLNWRGVITFVLSIGLIWVLAAGWWYIRNLTLYGELFGTRMMVAVAGPRIGGFSLQTLVDEFQGFRFAYWALFGAVNIMTFRWFYDVMDVISIFVLLGLITSFIVALRSKSSEANKRAQLDVLVTLLLLVLIVIAGTVSVAVWTSQTYASQGRLLFPFNATICILGATGLIFFWRYWIRPLIPQKLREYRATKSVYILVPFAIGCFALIVPFASIAPQYETPQTLQGLPDGIRSVYARFGDMALVGYSVDDRRYFPGDRVPVTVYWKVINTSTRDYSLYLQAIVDEGTVIGKVDSYPGAGRLRTSTWKTDAIYADSYEIVLDQTSNSVSKLRLHVGWWDYESKTLIDAVDESGRPLKSVMLDIGGFAPANTLQMVENMQTVEPVVFGNAVQLIGYRLDENMLDLVWKSVGGILADDTVFVQALDANNQVMGQGDAPPKLPTQYWHVGEQFITRHTITATTPMTSGSYRVILGWYNPIDGTRLVASSPENAYVLPVPLIVR
jgi:hypothetical protein